MTLENDQNNGEETPIPLTSRVTHKFYEPIILLSSLIRVAKDTAIPPPSEPPINVNDDKKVFQAFVNKLGHVCDYCKGGDTVTSFAILHGEAHGDIQYLFAVNQQERHELEDTAGFISKLLRKVGRVAGDPEHQDTARKELLCDVLVFNRVRVSIYLRILRSQIEECMERCRQEGSDDGTLLIDELSCFTDIGKDGASLNDPTLEYIQICENFIHALIQLLRSKAGDLITNRAQSGRMPGMKSVECWSNLLHTARRILAYPNSVKFILLARHRWPELFENPSVSFVPSSAAIRVQVRNKSLKAESIMGRMTRKAEQIKIFQEYVRTLQVFDLDQRIRTEYTKSSFSPIVHSEVLLLDWLENHGGTEASRFFNDWAYIGSSKPTCKLCNYFYEEHASDVEHRVSHGNLYPSWRLPDVLPSQGPDGLSRREIMFNKILQRVRNDAFDLIKRKLPPSYKSQDSNTFSATITLDNRWTMDHHSSTDIDDVASMLEEVALSDQGDTSYGEHEDIGGVPLYP